MVKFPESTARLQHGIFVCRKCKSKRRVSAQKVLQGKVKCRKCHSKYLRPLRKK